MALEEQYSHWLIQQQRCEIHEFGTTILVFLHLKIEEVSDVIILDSNILDNIFLFETHMSQACLLIQ